MKKILQLLTLVIISVQVNAQISFNETTPGVIEVAYGGEYSLYDPAGDTEIHLYMWVETTQTTPELAMVYNDDWGDASSLVTLTYSSDLDLFVGVIDFNTHDFIEEGILPATTTINDFNLILRNEVGDTQSADLVVSSYGFSGTTTLDTIDYLAKKASYFANGIFHLKGLALNQEIEIKVFDMLGKEIYKQKIFIKNKDTQIDLSHLEANFAIVNVSTSNDAYFSKKIVL